MKTEREDLAKKLVKELKDRSGYEFRFEVVSEPPLHWYCERKEMEYPVKSDRGEMLGLMFIRAERRSVYFDSNRLVKWPEDWIDPCPPFIDLIRFVNDFIEVNKGMDMDLSFMSEAYYAIDFGHFLKLNVLESLDTAKIVFGNREDRMKVSRFMPAVVKDFNIFLKLLNEVCVKYGIDRSEVDIYPSHFDCWTRFRIADMGDEEAVENVLIRVEALTELRRRFREWLPSDERRNYYESTMLFPEDPFRRRFRIPDATPTQGFSENRYEGRRRLYKWPFQSGDAQVDRKYEKKVKRALLDSFSRFYDLDGNRLRLARKVDKGLKFLGKVARRGLVRISEAEAKGLEGDDVVIAVDRRMSKLPKIPLEKMEFLKEDFPELWKK